jgi:leucyl aminopeptidase
MRISFGEEKVSENQHLAIITFNKNKLNLKGLINKGTQDLINAFLEENKSKKQIFETFFSSSISNSSQKILKLSVFRMQYDENSVNQQIFFGKVFSYLENKKISDLSLYLDKSSLKSVDEKKINQVFENILIGFKLKDYRFEKYKKFSRKDFKVEKIKILGVNSKPLRSKLIQKIENLEGIFLTRDLVSEPANILYPSKFVDFCKILKKVGVKIEVFDEKKLKSIGMNALLGVAQGSVRPARVMLMSWNGGRSKNSQPIAFIGKGVTFDTGGISIKPSSGMEDMKWDMGGAGVVAGLLYTLALRKSKANVIGAVGLVENMPDGNAQRPGDIVKSLSGQTIEVLNTDAEGRLVLADVLWYVNKRYKPKLMIDLATLTGAIIVALGDRYAGMFSNDDSLSQKILESSKYTKELIWRMPMDSEFDKLINCKIADMKNITGTRGAGSITAAQFLKRFVGDTSWAHLDIAGVTWSNKGTEFSRPGGTGFGVRLLDDFVKRNYES